MLRSLFLSLAVLSLPTARAADLREQVTIDGAFMFRVEFGLTLRSAAFSPDGKIMVTASTGGGSTTFWDPATGKELATLPEGDSVFSLAFSADGRILAGGPNQEDDGIRLWDVRTRKLIGRLKGRASLGWLALSPDGATVATGSVGEGDVLIWSVKTGKVLATLKAKAEDVWGLAFSGDGKRLAASYDDGVIRVWDVKAGRATATLTGHTGLVTAFAFAPGDRTLVSAGLDKTVRRWDLTTGKAAATTRLKGAVEPFRLVLGTGLDTLAGSERESGVLTIWDTKTGDPVCRYDAKVPPGVLAYSPDGKWLAADPFEDKFTTSIRVWAVVKPAGK